MSATVTQNEAARPDNMFGICARVGEDFGFNPLWLRIAFGCALIWNLEATLLAYAALGVFVAASRLLFPVRKAKSAAVVAPEAPAPVAAASFVEEIQLKKAA